MSISIVFAKQHDNPNGTVTGALEVDNEWASPDGRFLGELCDVHPDFAAHIVKCVNTYAALLKIATPDMTTEIQKALG